jgi:hypothetical protein
MATWKELLLDVLRLTDEVKRLVRLETMVEIAGQRRLPGN